MTASSEDSALEEPLSCRPVRELRLALSPQKYLCWKRSVLVMLSLRCHILCCIGSFIPVVYYWLFSERIRCQHDCSQMEIDSGKIPDFGIRDAQTLEVTIYNKSKNRDEYLRNVKRLLLHGCKLPSRFYVMKDLEVLIFPCIMLSVYGIVPYRTVLC